MFKIPNSDEILKELQNQCTIKSVDSVEFEEVQDKVECFVTLTTIYGGLNINV